mgnify:CR=1 FL=1
MRANFKLLATIAGATLLTSAAVSADVVQSDWGKVHRLLVHETEFGGCLAMMTDNSLETKSGGACTNWISFSCTGELNDEDTALRMFESAQIAFLTGREIRVDVDTTRKHNGHCMAVRFDYR